MRDLQELAAMHSSDHSHFSVDRHLSEEQTSDPTEMPLFKSGARQSLPNGSGIREQRKQEKFR